MVEFFTIDMGDWEDGYIYPELHIGDIFFMPQARDRATKYFNSAPEGPLWFLGDQGRYFPLNHRHAAFEEFLNSTFPTPAAQLAELERTMEDIDYTPDTFLHIGNHEMSMFRNAGNFYTNDNKGTAFVDRLGVQYAGLEAYYTLKWADGTTLKVLATHGQGLGTNPHLSRIEPGLGWRKSGNAKVWLRNRLGSIDRGASDLYIKGHEHRAYYSEPFDYTQMRQEGKQLRTRKVREAFVNKPIWAVCVGAAGHTRVKGSTTYQEAGSMAMCDVAMIHIHFDKENGKRIPRIEIVYLE